MGVGLGEIRTEIRAAKKVFHSWPPWYSRLSQILRHSHGNLEEAAFGCKGIGINWPKSLEGDNLIVGGITGSIFNDVKLAEGNKKVIYLNIYLLPIHEWIKHSFQKVLQTLQSLYNHSHLPSSSARGPATSHKVPVHWLENKPEEELEIKETLKTIPKHQEWNKH